MAGGPIKLGAFNLTTNTLFLAVAISIIGVSSLYLGILAKVINDLTGDATRKWLSRFRYDRNFVISACVVALGLLLDVAFVVIYVQQGFAILPSATRATHLAITGMLLVTLGFITFTYTLVLHAAAIRLTSLSRNGLTPR